MAKEFGELNDPEFSSVKLVYRYASTTTEIWKKECWKYFSWSKSKDIQTHIEVLKSVLTIEIKLLFLLLPCKRNMENEDGQSVSKNEIDNCKKADSSSEETALKKCALDAYGSCKLKVSLIKLNLGMPEQSGGPADSEKDLQECSAAAEKKINGEVTTESDNSLPKQNGSAADVEMAPLSIDVDESVEEGRGAENSRVESGLKRKLEDSTKLQDSSSSDEEAHSNSPVEFRGFKKRMIAKAEKTLHRQRQASETEYCPMTPETTPEEDSSVAEPENTRVLRSTTVKSKASDKEESGDQLTEYAQYLGLQPTVKFKCYRCGENNFQTMASLNEHHTNCSKANSGRSHTAAATKPLLSSQDSNPSTNFRITRKVYLCSACGTYYENWKLFLHMRDVHKRHICLYCLGMFAVADKLAEHLVLKHKVTYHTCNSPEQFLNISKGSGYLTCLTCERMFTERENFFDHECRAVTVTNALLCAKESTQTRPGQPDINRNSQSAGSSTVTNQSGSSAATKRFVSVPTLVRENWSGKPITIPRTSEFIDASSFCHVDLVDTHTDARKPSSSISTENHPIVVIDDDDDDEPTQLNRDKRSESTLQKTPPQKAISKMFPTLKKLSDLMENKDVEVDTSRMEVEKPCKEDGNNDLDKNRNPNTPSQSKTRKQTQNRLPQRTTRSSARVADMNSLDKKRKTEIALENSSSSDSESMDMDIATTKEAIGKEVFSSGEDDSDSNDAAKKTATSNKSGDISRRNAQKDKNSKQTSNRSIEKTEDLIAHSPPLFMEVVNESDNESLEEEPESDQIVNVADVVHTSSKVEEIEKTTEANKPRIEEDDYDEEEVVDKNQKESIEENSKTEENDKVREEKDVEVNNEEEAIDKNKKEDKFQVEEDKFASVSSESSDSSEEEQVVQQSEKNSDSAEKQVGKNIESAEKQVEKNSDSVEKQVENDSDSAEKQVEKHSDSAEKQVEKNSNSEERQVEKNSDSTLPNGPVSSSQEKSIVPYEDSEEEEEESDEDQPPKKIEESNVEHNGDGSNVGNNSDESDVQHNNDGGSDLENNKDESDVDDNEDESDLEHNKDGNDVEIHKNDDKSKEEHEESKDGNNDEQNDSNKTNVSQPANDSPENDKSSHDEDNRSVDSDDSDKLSVVLSGDSSDNGNSKSEDEDNVNRKDTKSNDDNVGNSESESQAMTNHSEELLNGRDDESECQKEADNTIETSFSFEGEMMQIASREVMAMALTLDDRMESLSAQSVIKECIRTSCTSCGYCNHAVKIAVNGKQLAAHLLAEHRYKPVKNETVDDVIDRLKQALSQLKDVWFNTDSYDSSDKSCFVPFDHTYECFQCNFVINTLKDLINHKRKVHQKTILYCSMCKANFYSYSELLCHMCPGVYVSEDIQFRCCFCDVDRIPSAFRLMVHLRKTHHTCDICLEIPGDQQKLSTHMWKHKLHHICYRCGIAYRNKPDITKHLFWKHGTESVLCKKCLQKKWPHVYHFCIPPTVFICEECNISFSKAVALKVHKRIHANDFPYSCMECSKKFVSRKILDKHIQSHNEPIVQEETDKNVIGTVSNKSDECKEAELESVDPTCDIRLVTTEQVQIDKKTAVADQEQDHQQSGEHSSKSHKKKSKKDRDKKSKPVVDVYDLPPLNLSSESDDSDDEMNSSKTNDNNATAATSSNSALPSLPLETCSEPIKDADASNVEKHSSVEKMDASDSNMNSAVVAEPPEILNISDDSQSAPIVDGIWDNFHSYKAEQEKREGTDPSSKTPSLANSVCEMPEKVNTSAILADHDYCFVPTPSHPTPASLHSSSMDHDYCTSSVNNKRSNHTENGNQYAPQTERKYSSTTPKKKQKSPKKSEKHNSSSSSDSSSDSDTTTCSNSKCSCCSSASGSSSSSTSDSDSSSSEGKRGKRDRKKEKTKTKKKDDSVTVTAAPDTSAVQEEEPVVDLPFEPEEPPIRESDLDTNESSTEEDFYDQYPQRHANQMLAEKRNQLMVLATVAPVNNGIASPPPPPEQTPISAPPLPLEETLPKPSPVQRRGRKKRRRGRAPTKNQSNPATPSPLTYESQPSTSFGRTPLPTTPTPNSAARKKARPSVDTDSSKRLSKRRRVPNKFYGYSSDEEEEMQQSQPATVPAAKWRRVEPSPAPAPAATTPVASPEGYHPRLSIKQHYDDNTVQYSSGMPAAAAAASSSAGGSSSSGSGSESSGSDSDSESEPIAPPPAVVVNPPRTDKDEKLYCYCQCPYDEVSEMIACDGSDCHIEWFHFECVGIMVPPKGKWYCPDCKRRRNLI